MQDWKSRMGSAPLLLISHKKNGLRGAGSGLSKQCPQARIVAIGHTYRRPVSHTLQVGCAKWAWLWEAWEVGTL